jgi:hypothetical protein
MKICGVCRLLQKDGVRCAACGQQALRPIDDPALLVPRKSLRLTRFEWNELSFPLKLLLVLLFVAALLVAPILVGLAIYALTESEQAGVWGIFGMLIAPWLVAAGRPALRRVISGTKSQLSSVAPLQLSGRAVRSGRAVGCGKWVTDATGAESLVVISSAREGDRFLAWETKSVEFDVIDERGEIMRVTGQLTSKDGHALAESEAARVVGEWRLPVRGSLEIFVVREGDRVELRGDVVREQSASGYRDSAEIEVMRGRPGSPIEIRLI